MKLQNNLIDAELDVADEGLLLSGTNGRFGLRGAVSLRPRGRRSFLRRSEFGSHGKVACASTDADAHRASRRRNLRVTRVSSLSDQHDGRDRSADGHSDREWFERGDAHVERRPLANPAPRPR